MDQRRIVILQAGVLMVSLFASAAVKNTTRITVLDSETRSFTTDDNGVPKNCDPTTYDAYCHSSKTAEVTNTLLVQEDNGPPFRITCTIESKWSRCIPLPKGESFEARREKRGVTVYYVDDEGKLRKQLYTYVTEKNKGNVPQPAADRETEPSPVLTGKVERGTTPAATSDSPQVRVKCSFTSTPSGAEVTVDGQYVGSTPSVLNISAGNHAVQVSLPGFAPWKRQLTVSLGSELTVNAVLEKVQ